MSSPASPPDASVPAHWSRAEATAHFPDVFNCEFGGSLPELKIRYTSYGVLSPSRDNVVWALHPLTCNSDILDWWPEMVGLGRALDPTRDFIICANSIGSCYGSTGPSSESSLTGTQFGFDFPVITMKDVVRALDLLRESLGIDRIRFGIGASYGGQQLLEWMVMKPGLFDNGCVAGATDRQSPWAVALNESQRLAIEADPTTFTNSETAGAAGLAAARSFAVLSYRTPKAYELRQAESDDSVADNFRASTYQRHIGSRFTRRFDAKSYWFLTKAMDSHNISRGRVSREHALHSIDSPLLLLGLEGDILFPPETVREVSSSMRRSEYAEIKCDYGHDSVLIHASEIERHVIGHRFQG